MGVVLALSLYFALLMKIVNNAQTAADTAGVHICMGAAAIFLFHIVVNIGMVRPHAGDRDSLAADELRRVEFVVDFLVVGFGEQRSLAAFYQLSRSARVIAGAVGAACSRQGCGGSPMVCSQFCTGRGGEACESRFVFESLRKGRRPTAQQRLLGRFSGAGSVERCGSEDRSASWLKTTGFSWPQRFDVLSEVRTNNIKGPRCTTRSLSAGDASHTALWVWCTLETHMTKELIVSSTSHEASVALLEDDQLVEIYIARGAQHGLAGSIYKGRVTRVLPGMQSAFVNIGLDRDAFLYVSDFVGEIEDMDEARRRRRPRGSRRPPPRPSRSCAVPAKGASSSNSPGSPAPAAGSKPAGGAPRVGEPDAGGPRERDREADGERGGEREGRGGRGRGCGAAVGGAGAYPIPSTRGSTTQRRPRAPSGEIRRPDPEERQRAAERRKPQGAERGERRRGGDAHAAVRMSSP